MIDVRTALYCLEVGQGASAALVEPIPGVANENQATLIDVGANGRRLAAWLAIRVTRIPAILLSHNDRDHVGALAQLVHAYKKKINRVLLVPDRKQAPSTWLPAEQWEADEWVREIDVLSAPLTSHQSPGRLIVGPDDGCSFRLYCAYPPTPWLFSLFGWVPARLSFFLPGGNRLSAVLRLTSADTGAPTHALFGGDLDYQGWKYLASRRRDLSCEVFLVPHHGGPQRRTKDFGPAQLAQATCPRFALISAGTNNADSLPHEDLIRAMHGAGATVLCTQITDQCLSGATPPATVPNLAVRPRLPSAPCLAPGGTACAGSIVVTFPANGPEVDRLLAHQTEVNRLQASGHLPLCRR
jgi:beta-lactamase superfamily II metal-dependent hydrolase